MSTAIDSIDYDEAWETLTIRFVDGSTYTYSRVPQDVYAALLYAGSTGGFFNSDIRGKYSYRRGAI